MKILGRPRNLHEGPGGPLPSQIFPEVGEDDVGNGDRNVQVGIKCDRGI